MLLLNKILNVALTCTDFEHYIELNEIQHIWINNKGRECVVGNERIIEKSQKYFESSKYHRNNEIEVNIGKYAHESMPG